MKLKFIPREKVEELLKEFNIDDYPIPIVKIAENLGFEVYEAEFGNDESGLLYYSKDKEKIILLNKNDIPTRKKFTIAHELGHYLNEFESGQIYAHRNSNSSDPNYESEINRFASELLMPTKILKNFLENIDYKSKDFDFVASLIASAFLVSFSAAKVRLDKFLRGQNE